MTPANNNKFSEEEVSPKIEIVKEIRFAVVLYGGVSLAIYINGVAQELLSMVRATAVETQPDGTQTFRIPSDLPAAAPEKLSAVEEMYRDLAYLLADEEFLKSGGLLKDYRIWLKKYGFSSNSGSISQNPLRQKLAEKRRRGETIKAVRFVVDVLSGTSAGGINGVYMAKALAAGQTIGGLEKLWETEGDFLKLLRNENSLRDGKTPLGLPELDQSSLLNSERMYYKLLKAFGDMDDPKTKCGPPAFVDEVDLFVTTTDYWGTPVPLKLYDRLIHERRHRHVFRFKFRDGDVNDFDNRLYPFLAYTARCTSSFPLAFDPMTIVGANKVIKSVNGKNQVKSGRITENIWGKFFTPVTIEHPDERVRWNERVFVDGGYLDNKPFGYAIEALAQKQSNVLVDRKLIYVEPKPELDDSAERARKKEAPGALKNTLAALTEMPTYETIREDLQQVLKRNRLIIRVNHLLSNAHRDELLSFKLSADHLSEIIKQSRHLIEKRKGRDWTELTLGELAQQKGQSVNPYYRLRVTSLTDDLARMVTRRANFDPDSDYFFAIRDLVRWWREKNFSNEDENDKTAKTPMYFLKNYDYTYRFRRLRFVLQQADRLLHADKDLRKELIRTVKIAKELRNDTPAELETPTGDGINNLQALREYFQLLDPKIFDPKIETEKMSSAIIRRKLRTERDALHSSVRKFKAKINEILNALRKDMRRVEPTAGIALKAEDSFIAKKVQELDAEVAATAQRLGLDGLHALLGRSGASGGSGARDESDLDSNIRLKRAEKVIKNKNIEGNLEEIGKILREIYNGCAEESVFEKARNAAENLFKVENSDSENLDDAVREYLGHFYRNFDAYDQILFPVTYETPIGEGVIVDVARISPLDADNLIDETLERQIAARLADTGGKPIESPAVRRKINRAIARRKLRPGYKAKRKVAGDTLFSFGAFFEKEWRSNDILWGRLDAVDRLVSLVVPANGLRRAFVHEAQEMILKENFQKQSAPDEKTLLQKNYEKCACDNVPGNRKFTHFMSAHYSINRNLKKKDLLKTAALSMKVLSPVVTADKQMIGEGRHFARFAFIVLESLVNSFTWFNIVVLAGLAAVFFVGAALLYTAFFNLNSNWAAAAGGVILLALAISLLGVWLFLKLKIARAVMKNITGQ